MIRDAFITLISILDLASYYHSSNDSVSSDYAFFSLISTFCRISYSIGYCFLIDSYASRYPIHPNLPLCLFALPFDICLLYILSRFSFRSVSKLALIVSALFIPLLYYVLTILDFFDLLWFIDHTLSSIKLVPQLYINFCTYSPSHSPLFFLLQLLSLLILISLRFSYNWYDIPVNLNGVPYIFVYGSSILVLMVQFRLYGKREVDNEVAKGVKIV